MIDSLFFFSQISIHSEKVRADELCNLQEADTVFAIKYLLQLLVADYNLLVLWIL